MSDGRQAAFFFVLAPAAACWLAGLLWLGPHVLLTVPSVLLLGYAFWLDATETCGTSPRWTCGWPSSPRA